MYFDFILFYEIYSYQSSFISEMVQQFRSNIYNLIAIFLFIGVPTYANQKALLSIESNAARKMVQQALSLNYAYQPLPLPVTHINSIHTLSWLLSCFCFITYEWGHFAYLR